MAAPTLVFVFLFFSAAVTIGIINAVTLPYDRSPVCSKALRFPADYPPIKVACCDPGSACDKFILPNGTNYGLTNSDETWQRRSCTCEYEMFVCIMRDLPDNWENSFLLKLREEICFYQQVIRSKSGIKQSVYHWSSLLPAVKYLSANKDSRLIGSPSPSQ